MKTKVINLITWILVSIILFGIILLWNSKALGQEWTAEQKEVWEAALRCLATARLPIFLIRWGGFLDRPAIERQQPILRDFLPLGRSDNLAAG